MNWDEYMTLFEKVVTGELKEPPYDQAEYVEYVTLNKSRVKRWMKTAALSKETIAKFSTITEPQKWVLITEPWCADAANIAPIVYQIAQLSPLISFEIKLRDSTPGLIENYLTNGTKSIPILVIRDEFDFDKYIWGPRPKNCQKRVDSIKLKGADSKQIKEEVQRWYNGDKGVSIQQELCKLNDYHKTHDGIVNN